MVAEILAATLYLLAVFALLVHLLFESAKTSECGSTVNECVRPDAQCEGARPKVSLKSMLMPLVLAYCGVFFNVCVIKAMLAIYKMV